MKHTGRTLSTSRHLRDSIHDDELNTLLAECQHFGVDAAVSDDELHHANPDTNVHVPLTDADRAHLKPAPRDNIAYLDLQKVWDTSQARRARA